MACWGCGVPAAMRLREQRRKLIELHEEIEKNMASGDPSDFWVEVCEYRKKPEAIKGDMLPFVELKFLEEDGGTEGRTCRRFKHNKYLCPYGEESKELIRLGGIVNSLRKLVRFYDFHWNRSSSFTPGAGDEKWFHYDEPGFLDVTSYKDILDALGDGRMDRITDEYVKYEKEVKANQPVHATSLAEDSDVE